MLGDIAGDLHAVAQLSQSFQQAGGIGPWLSNRLTAFHALPGDVATLRAQSDAVRKILTGSTANLDPLNDANADLARVQRDYSGVNARVNVLVSALLPLMPKINAGTYDTQVLAALAKNGTDILGTVYGVNDLIAAKDRAQDTIERVVTNSDLPSDTRQRALAALAGGGGIASVLPLLVAVGIGALVVKAVWK